MSKEIVIRAQGELRDRMLQAWHAVNAAIQSGPVAVVIGRESKTREMERKYHAMIRDIADQVTFFGTKKYAPEIWKALLVDQFEQEKLAMGEPLAHPGQLITSMDGQRTITVRASTRQFRKHEAGEFIEFLYAKGAEMGVDWSEPAMAVYQEWMRESKGERAA